MVMSKTLEELKAENAATEIETDTPPQAEPEETLEEAVEIETEVPAEDAEPEPDVESEAEEPVKDDTEDWMKADEEGDAEVTDNDKIWATSRKHFQGKLEKVKDEKNTEIDELRKEIAQLRSGGVQPQTALNRPRREDFLDSDDPEEAYIDALTDYKLATNNARQAAQTVESQQNEKQQQVLNEISTNVDQHYERAAKLSEQSGISADMYKSSDQMVRETIDSVYRGQGDLIADKLIADLGEGSEKVMYSLGVNNAKRNKLKQLLSEDPVGTKAAIYLGTLKAELNAPQSRRTNAPKPAPTTQGDATKDPHKDLKKRYDKANKSGDTQAAFNIRMAAKEAGADYKNW